MLILLFIVALLMFIESLRRAGRADAGMIFALKLTALEVPAVMAQVFPLVLMLGALATFQALSRSSELVIIRAARPARRRLSMNIRSATMKRRISITTITRVRKTRRR
ncbi:MAG: LptF/LptG family permease, partial [Pseudomonadota bacterium]